jgi:methylated-DNA-[protein]-cysteine S-methyltransferase
VISCYEMASPIGPLLLWGDAEGLRGVSFQKAHPVLPPAAWRRMREPFDEAIEQLTAYFAGRLERFQVPLAPHGTRFQLEVWSALRAIPYGETTTYGAIARRLGRSNAFRAVGAANGRNPIPILIPCHRVVGADGSLTGFGGGLDIKRALLALEARHRRVLARGETSPLFPEARCLPDLTDRG